MKYLLLVLALVAAPHDSGAAIREVPQQFATIQEGILAAVHGDTVLVADGTYGGPGNRDIDFMGKSMLVVSESGDPDSCTIDCGGSWLEPHRGFWFHAGEDSASVLRGFKIINGYSSGYGGAILCGEAGEDVAASPRIMDCVLESNDAAQGAAFDVWGRESHPRLDRLEIVGNHCTGMAWNQADASAWIRDCAITGNDGHGVHVPAGGFWSLQLRLSRCVIGDNELSGVGFYSMYGSTTLDTCLVTGNLGWGIEISCIEDGICSVNGGELRGNASGGASIQNSVWGRLQGVDICDNSGSGVMAGRLGMFLSLVDCRVDGNLGDGVIIGDSGSRSYVQAKPRWAAGVRDCVVTGNSGRGVNVRLDLPSPFRIEGCTISGNESSGIEVTSNQLGSSRLSVAGNTVAYNNGPGLLYASAIPCSLSSNIIAFNAGLGWSLGVPGGVVMVANDSYGNVLGDWEGAAAANLGEAGNFSGNPLFVAAVAGDLTLAENSPCLPGNHPDGYVAGLIGAEPQGGGPIDYEPDRVVMVPDQWIHLRPEGAFDVQVTLVDAAGGVVPDQGAPPSVTTVNGLGDLTAIVLESPTEWIWHATYHAGAQTGIDGIRLTDPECATQRSDSLFIDITDKAVITSVRDVPGDQGGQVRVIWERDLRDIPGHQTPISQYVVWRRFLDGGRLADRVVAAEPDIDTIAHAWNAGDSPPLWRDTRGVLWEPVGPVVPAMMWEAYASVVPTLQDSTGDNAGLSVFQVSAHTFQPQLFFVSMPDSGHSTDDLSPLPPSGLMVAYAANGNSLAWQAGMDEDLAGYVVYRGAVTDILPNAVLEIARTGSTHWEDSTEDPWRWQYLVTAVDHVGNESPYSAPGSTSMVEDVHGRPAGQFIGVHPNPFNPRTVLRFECAGGDVVTLKIYDLGGACLRTLEDGVMSSGIHDVCWDGLDDAGHRLPSGTYIARLGAGSRVVKAKLVLVR